MSETKPNPTLVRTFTTTSPIRACRLRRGDLKWLYRIINDRLIEYRETVLNQQSQQLNETLEQFQERKARVANSFTTTVNVTRANQEVVSGQQESFFDTTNIPENILTVFYTTMAGPSVIGLAPQQQQSRATLILDCSRPPVLDVTKFPTMATENASNFSLFSSSESWFTALNKRLTDFFNERRTGWDWLHRAGIYDLLLFVIGIPFALAIDYACSGIIGKLQLPSVLEVGLYVYLFFVGLYVFRALFTYSRWVFPKIEIMHSETSPQRHRGVWLAIMLGIPGAVFGGAILEAIKALW